MSEKQGFHEDFGRADQPKVGSERGFGIVFCVVFAVIGLWPVIDGAAPRLWSIAVAGLFLAVAYLAPAALRPLNRVWFLFGLALHKVVNPLVMGLLFFTTITPIALIMRLVGKDPLKRRFDPDAASYWIERQPAGPAPETMKNQF